MSALKRFAATYLGPENFPFDPFGPAPRPKDDNLAPSTRDALFDWQIRGQDFQRLDADSLVQARVCETKYYANSVLSTCHSVGVIDRESGTPDTTKIDRKLVSKIAIIFVPKQGELVNMLVFWEEECTRWRLLELEERELVGRLEGVGAEEDESIAVEESLKVVRAEKRIPPSLRDENGKVVDGEELPA